MKRMRLIITLLALAAMLAMPLTAGAQGGTWVSGIMIQNLDKDHAATVTITFYWAEDQAGHAAGSVAGTKTVTIPADKAEGFYIPDLVLDSSAKLPDNFVGSAVVTSDYPVAANVNTQVPTTSGASPSDPNRIGTASGVTEAAQKLYFTQVMKNYWGWNSYIAVQNTSGTAANVTVKYYNDSDGSELVAARQTKTIAPYATAIFRQSDNASIASGWGGSAVVEGDQLLAGIANFYNAGGTADQAAFQSYNPFIEGATTLYVPRLLQNYFGYQGGIKIQNVGSANTNVTIKYYFGGSQYTQVISGLKPGAAYPIYMPDVAEVPDSVGGHPTGAGSAIITSSDGVPIVATVNEDNRVGASVPNGIAGHEGRGTTYNAFLGIPAKLTNTVFFSQVTARYYGYSGGIQVQNVGSSPAHITATFSASGFADKTVTATLQPNESTSWYAPNVVDRPDFNGSVVVTSDQPIAGIANNSHRSDTDTRYATNYGDSYSCYNGINK